MFRAIPFCLTLLILTTGCGKFASVNRSASSHGASLSAKPYGTCDRKNVATFNLCVEVTGPEYNDVGYLDLYKSSCESTGGAYSTNNCDFTGSFGTCIIQGGMSNETHITYFAPEYTAQSAEQACTMVTGGVYYPH